MLINCPRCGFSQPQDQYCAQCGVDMQSFRPKTPSFVVRFFGNAIVQIVLLILCAVWIGQSIILRNEPQSWVRKISPFQGISRSVAHPESANSKDTTSYPDTVESTAAGTYAEMSSRQNQDGNAKATPPESEIPIGATANTDAAPENNDPDAITFKLTYAEIPYETLAAWVAESTNAGHYQNLPEYSAGIIGDYSKKSEGLKQVLKSAALKLSPSTTNSHISGNMTDDGAQIMGLIAAVEFRSIENEVIQGNISLTRSNGRSSENLPAEFHLPQGTAFFILGALKRDSFSSERERLNMPPFQVFKSPDFITGKSEFIVILEPIPKQP